jgi:hypothetical protein
MMKTWKFWLLTLLALMLFTATGCEALQGYEIGKALQNSALTTSSESKGTIQIKLQKGNMDAASDQEKLVYELFSNMKLSIDSAKMKDESHISLDGAFVYKSGSIPFKLVYEKDQFIIDIEGAKKPVVFSNTGAADSLTSVIYESLQQDLEAKVKEIVPILTNYMIDKAPNPSTISLEQVTEKVNNESLSMKKLHAEIYGDELKGLLHKFLSNILSDEEALKELIGQLYDSLMPLIKESAQAAQKGITESLSDQSALPGTEMLSESEFIPDLIFAYMDNKTLVVEFAFTTLQQALKYALAELDKPSEEVDEFGVGAQLDTILNKKNYVKADLYIDQDQQIRKQHVEMNISLSEEMAIAGVKITMDSESWNLNKAVDIDKIDLSKGQFNVEDMGSMNEYELLRNLETDSQIYKLLQNELQIAKKEYSMILTNGIELDYYSTHPFINDEGYAMIPVHFASDVFGAKVEWNDELQQTIIVDAKSGTTLAITTDSDTATVNGSDVTLVSKAVSINDSVFIPLRFLTDAFEIELEWDESTQMIQLNRE